jgi:hypothetical protein
VSEGERAERAYRAAIERLGRTRLRPELARRTCSTASGCAVSTAASTPRAPARRARPAHAIGMEAFAERARRELLATGEKVRRRTSRRATS